MRKCKIDAALDELNEARGLKYPDIGYSYFADIKGDGLRWRRSVWTISTEHGGVSRSGLNGDNARVTLWRIREATRIYKFEPYALMIRAIHERGESQRVALQVLEWRGLWLSDGQKKQARLPV